MRKTKIVCTLGLASQTPEIISEMMMAGMNVARFNFSHGTHESHGKVYGFVRECSEKLNLPVATLLDTKGPEIRLGEFDGGKIQLKEGSTFTLTTQQITGNAERASVSYDGLAADLSAGDRVLIDDGLIELRVTEIRDSDIICDVINGGPVSNRKGVNIPGVQLSMPYISEKDRADIRFGVKTGFDFIAASFVRSAQDILELRSVMKQYGDSSMRVIAKIENTEGVQNIDEILRVSDGVMVARGDMGVEIPFEQLPAIQKMMIRKAYQAGKIVITATQMLESMIYNPRPTRAETSDVANAIYDGTSAIMLSGETAMGNYPVKAVKTMARIAVETESGINYKKRFQAGQHGGEGNVTTAISHATCTTAYDLGAAAIIAVTISGQTARMVSRYRPDIPIIACTIHQKTYQQLAMSWGCVPMKIEAQTDLDDLFSHVVDAAQANGLVSSGELVVITTGVPLGTTGTTNLLKVHVAGDVLLNGQGVNRLSVCAPLCVAQNTEEALGRFRQGDILVIHETVNEILPLMKQAAGIITEVGGMDCHAAVAGLALDIPVIVGAENATNILKSGTIVTLDAERGVVCNTSTSGTV